MRCPKCGYISFDQVESCTKCGKNISDASGKLSGMVLAVDSPSFSRSRFVPRRGDTTLIVCFVFVPTNYSSNCCTSC